MKSSWLRVVALCGAGMVAVSLLASSLVLLLRYSSLQESSVRMMGLAGMDAQLMLVSCAVATFGAAITSGETRRTLRSPFGLSVAGATLSWCLFFVVAAPALSGWDALKGDPSASSFTLVVENLWYRNEDPLNTADKVLATRPQVLVLLEYTQAHADAFRDAGAFDTYSYRWEQVEPYGHGIAVLSTIPFSHPVDLGLSGAGVRVKLALGDSAVELYALHFNAPTSIWDIPRWRSDFELSTRLLQQSNPNTIVAGDLNATQGHIRFRRLLEAARLKDAQDVGFAGFATTWPASGPFPTLLRLDHILLGTGICLDSFERLAPNGSDHLGLRAELCFAQPAA